LTIARKSFDGFEESVELGGPGSLIHVLSKISFEEI